MGAFLAATAADPFWHVVFRFMAETWVRIGELSALRWDSVDLVTATVRIEEAVTRDSNRKRTTGTPKTAKSRRVLPISRELTDLLRAHRDRQRFTGGSDLVFPGQRSGQWMQQPAIAGALLKYCRTAGVPEITPHGLRHIGGSIAYMSGMNLQLVSERMGHSDPAFTARIYMHTDQTSHRVAADEFARLLARAKVAGQ
jgi:integrase